MAHEFFYKVAKFLRNNNLADKPVVIRRCKLKKDFDGLCEKKKNKFIISINKNLSENYSVDVMLHEVAHAVSWDKDNEVHGLSWGKAYSRVYRLFEENFLDD